uniref:Uncharacterized protein n=1 Tax=Solanum tuberosum TaxID=4113 RepID=M1DA38_SOLTU
MPGTTDRRSGNNPWSRAVAQTLRILLPDVIRRLTRTGRRSTYDPSVTPNNFQVKVHVLSIQITHRSVLDLQFSSISGESSFFEDE